MYPVVVFSKFIIFIYSFIIKMMSIICISIYNKIKKNNSPNIILTITKSKKKNEDMFKMIDMEEINKKVNQIKSKVEENEMKLVEYEKNIRIADLEIKKYEYEYKIIEIKGNIITECTSILKKIISIIDKDSI
jgi:hypothetical protein